MAMTDRVIPHVRHGYPVRRRNTQVEGNLSNGTNLAASMNAGKAITITNFLILGNPMLNEYMDFTRVVWIVQIFPRAKSR